VSIKEFKEKVMKLQEVIDVKEIDGYDSNVLVIVKNKSDELIRKIARIALEVNSKYDCLVNFYVSTKYE
jgi:GTPase